MFDLLHYDKYFIPMIFRIFFQCPFPFIYKFVDGKIFAFLQMKTFKQSEPVCIFEHRFGINA